MLPESPHALLHPALAHLQFFGCHPNLSNSGETSLYGYKANFSRARQPTISA
jgi:hypothetical protein